MVKKFFTPDGLLVPAVTADQMKEIDCIAIEETGPNLYQMMENAGRNLAELTIEVLGENWREQKILILAGTSGNGGGGICAARHLSNRGGDVTLCISDPDKLREVTAYQLHIFKSTKAKLISVNNLDNNTPDLIIDAIIGYSLQGDPYGNPLEMIKWMNRQFGNKISLDVPSGINATNGNHFINFVKPDLTLTLALPKTGLRPDLTGELYLSDLGIPLSTYKKAGLKIPETLFNTNYILPLYSHQEIISI